jgi:hypothetical protein
MVSWQKLVELAFDIADQKGAEFEGISDGGEFMSDLAAVWSQNKEQWKQYTEQQARNELLKVIEA